MSIADNYLCKNCSIGYKYRPIDENTWKFLENGEVFFSFPSTFNDIYDTQLPISSIDEFKLLSVRKALEGIRKDEMGVFCLSKNPLSIPMWIYYGTSNSGIAI